MITERECRIFWFCIDIALSSSMILFYLAKFEIQIIQNKYMHLWFNI